MNAWEWMIIKGSYKLVLSLIPAKLLSKLLVSHGKWTFPISTINLPSTTCSLVYF